MTEANMPTVVKMATIELPINTPITRAAHPAPRNICRKTLPLTMFGPSRQGDLGHRRNCEPCQERREVLMATRKERMAMVEARRQQVQEATAKINGLMDSTEDRVIETPGLASQVVEIPSLVAVPPYGGGFLPRFPQYDIAPPKETKPEQDPEAMAVKVLIKRHREEYDSLVETFMEGLWS